MEGHTAELIGQRGRGRLHGGGDASQFGACQAGKQKAFQTEGTAPAGAQRAESTWQVPGWDDEAGVVGEAPATQPGRQVGHQDHQQWGATLGFC